MRFEGTIKSWNDERGFGFIGSTLGGQDIFVHIKAFKGPPGRPQVGQRVTFEVQLGPQGKKRALNVEMAPVARKALSPARRQSRAPWSTASLLAIPVLLAVVLAAHVFGHPPRWALWAYPALSLVTFVAYAMDKSAARQGAWRTPEKTLHMLSLIGGWPGALLAQQWLRHKSSKAEFRSVFWVTVVLNLAAFTFLASPQAQQLARSALST